MAYEPSIGTRSHFTPLKALLILLLVVALGGAGYVALKPSDVKQSGQIIGFSAVPSAPPKTKVVIIRSSQTGCGTAGGCDEANYTQLLAAKMRWNVTVLSQAGAGYVSGMKSTPPADFASLVPDAVAAAPDVVLIEGSRFDRFFDQATIQAAVAKLLADLKAALPTVKIVTIGPIAGGDSSGVTVAQTAVKAASTGLASLFIDPIADGWFTGDNAKLEAADGKSITNAGHVYMAGLIAADITSAGLP